MTVTASPRDLEWGYEALRAQATGTIPAVRPRGRAVLCRAGMVAWMRACPPGAPATSRGSSGIAARTVPGGLGGELVSVLTEMALGAGRGWHDVP